MFRPQVFSSLRQMETLKQYFINRVYVVHRKKNSNTRNEENFCEWASKGQLTSVRASAGWRWVIVRVRQPLPTRPARMGKGILEQLAELEPPAWKSGQLRPVNQMKGHKYKEQRERKPMHMLAECMSCSTHVSTIDHSLYLTHSGLNRRKVLTCLRPTTFSFKGEK